MDSNPLQPAFPRDHRHDGHNGMLLRDYFAAHAPAPPEQWHGGERKVGDLVAWRWWYADAMLAVR